MSIWPDKAENEKNLLSYIEIGEQILYSWMILKLTKINFTTMKVLYF